MKKRVILLFGILSLLLIPFIFAEENETTTLTGSIENPEVEKAFSCLETKVGDSCQNINSVEELALTILATPKDIVYESCVKKLESKLTGSNINSISIKDVSLSILALNHAGKETKNLQEWIISQERNPLEIEWFLQVDSNKATKCNITYNTKDYYEFNLSDNKRINLLKSRGDCFTIEKNFWLKVKPGCYNNQTFTVSCQEDFNTNLFYQQTNNNERIFVIDNTISSPAYNRVELLVQSRCFSPTKQGSCNFEDNVWATYALAVTGNDIQKYMPYIYAMAESSENQKYLPDAFIYLLNINSQNYATRLISSQRSEGNWNIANTPYTTIHDTALALLSLGISTDEKTQRARDWLVYTQQGSDGCWRSNVKDTAFVLWSIERRPGKTVAGEVVRCEDLGYSCVSTNNCVSGGILNQYYCSSLGAQCCSELKRCTEISGGKICAENQECSGTTIKSKDTNVCCLSECVEKKVLSECEQESYSCLENPCSGNYISQDFSCNDGKYCCKYSPQTTKPKEKKSGIIWLIIGLIVLALIVLLIVFREKLKVFLFKLKNNKKGGGANNNQNNNGFPPRGGPGNYPPQRYPRPIPMRPGMNRPPFPPQRPQMPPQQ